MCQAETPESLTSPACSKRKDVGRTYEALAENLMKFNALGILPTTLQLDRIDEGQGIEASMSANEAKWHQSCKLRYNKTMLQRAEKRKNLGSDTVSRKCSRFHNEATSMRQLVSSVVTQQVPMVFMHKALNTKLNTKKKHVIIIILLLCYYYYYFIIIIIIIIIYYYYYYVDNK